VLYASGYDDKSLADWARRVSDWAQGREPQDAERVIDKAGLTHGARDVYVYFDNDVKVRAPVDAMSLAARIAKMSAKPKA
jgi:uncharacterized protein YecE (DUF72 family)